MPSSWRRGPTGSPTRLSRAPPPAPRPGSSATTAAARQQGETEAEAGPERRDIVATALTKRLFARAARQKVIVDDDLASRVEILLAERCREQIGLARRAGQAVMGFAKVEAALAQSKAGVLLAAADGAADGRGKLKALAPGLPLVEQLTGTELGAAFGREHVVHAAVAPGPLARALIAEAARLAGFRGAPREGVSLESDGSGAR